MVPNNNKQTKQKKRGVRIGRARSVSRASSVPRARTPAPAMRGNTQPTQLGQLLRDGGGGIGSAIGGAFGMPVLGGTLGRLGGALVSRLTGNGDYTLTKNTSLGLGGTIPEFAKAGRIRFSNRECLGAISTSNAFTLQKVIEINPGLASSFPQLSMIARLFEKYVVHGMVVTFDSTSATSIGSTNTALGSLILATEYQVGRSNPTSLTEILAMKYVNQAAPSVTQVHGIECDGSQNIVSQYIVRTGAVPTGQDQHLFDPCRVIVATQGAQAASTAGLLYVTYDVELFNPNITGSQAVQYYQQYSPTGLFTDLFTPPGYPIGQLSTAGPTYATFAGHTITFSATGEYFVEVMAYTTDATGWVNNLNFPSSTVNSMVLGFSYNNSGVNTRQSRHLWCIVTEPGQYINVMGSATTVGPFPSFVRVMVVPEPWVDSQTMPVVI